MLPNQFLRKAKPILWRLIESLPLKFSTRLAWEAMERAHYGYGTYFAARQAAALGMDRVSAIEFGVAGGNGLFAMERIARAVEEEVGIGVDVYGFDGAQGLPPPIDYRDLPCVWQQGFYQMDVEKLTARLSKAELVLGPVEETVQRFCSSANPAPIGFISFDLDFYSSTKNAFKLFESDLRCFLPRVFCYFDDIDGNEFAPYTQYVGEILAIDEFNQEHDDKKIAKLNGIHWRRRIPRAWNDKIYILHLFNHPDYNTFIYPDTNQQLPLR